MTAQLQRFHDTIEQACTAIQGHVADLATDWDTRPAEFWQEVLTALQALREIVQPAIAYSLCGKDEVTTGFIAIRYSLMISIGHVGALIDQAGIEVTSYRSVCRSKQVQHLQRRQWIVQVLRDLTQEVEKALDLMGPKGQQQCVDQHRKHQREVAALLAQERKTRVVKRRRRGNGC